jgi:hypothetical protein
VICWKLYQKVLTISRNYVTINSLCHLSYLNPPNQSPLEAALLTVILGLDLIICLCHHAFQSGCLFICIFQYLYYCKCLP